MKTTIKELRARYNITQEDLAQLTGVTRATIGFLEKGTYNPSLKLAFKISKVLKEDVNNIFVFDDDELL